MLDDVERSVRLGPRAYFFADTAGLGMELWSSDGTPEGTRLVIDLDPGPFGARGPLTTWNGQLAFSTHSGVWLSDGTRVGTRRIARAECEVLLPFAEALLCGGKGLFRIDASGQVDALEDTRVGPVAQLVPFEGAVWFIGTDGSVWLTDGTRLGTRRFKSLLSRRLVVMGQHLFIIGSDSTAPTDGLWRTNGTLAGTTRLHDAQHVAGSLLLTPGKTVVYFNDLTGLWVTDGVVTTQIGSFHWPVRVVGDRIYFPADGQGLMTSEAGPALRLTSEGTVFSMAPLGDTLLFTTRLSGVDSLMKTDGSAAGTSTVATLRSNEFPLLHFGFVLDGIRYFQNTTTGEGMEVWRTDGTAAGTRLFADLSPSVLNAVARPLPLSPSRLLFLVGEDLWRTEGTPETTIRLGPVEPPYEFAAFGRRALYSAGGTLWVTDGTLAGSQPLLDGAPGPSGAHNLRGGPTKAFFLDDLKQLSVTDGTREGTFSLPIMDLESFSMVGDAAFFLAADPGLRLWRTAGASAATSLVYDFGGASVFWLPGTPDGELMFSGGPPRVAWRSDGTTQGTRTIGPVPHEVRSWMSLGRRTLAILRDERGSEDPLDDTIELWSTDTTGTNFDRVKQLATAPAADDYDMTWAAFGDSLYFVFDDGIAGRELWRTDGTLAHTERFTDLAPGPLNGVPARAALLSAGERLWFSGSDGIHGCELWRTDGTLANTHMVIDAHPGEPSACPTWLAHTNGTLVFAADEGSGSKLWALAEPDEGSTDAGRPSAPQELNVEPSALGELPAPRRGCGCSGDGEYVFGLALALVVLSRRVVR